jgi:hypothetical protein
MPAEAPLQASISDLLDATIERMVADGLKPAAIYLTPADYDRLAAEETQWWQEQSGSEAKLWPCSFRNVLLIAESLIEKVEVPLRRRTGLIKLKSTIYASNGAGYPVSLP